MQLNSTSASDSNSDMKAYIFVRDAEKRQDERLNNAINDFKEIIKENFKSMKDDMAKMEERMEMKMDNLEERMELKMDNLEERMDKISQDSTENKNEILFIKLSILATFLILLSIQPDLRSLISIIIKFINV